MSIRQRGYPGGDQLAVLQMHCDQARYVYNLGLEHRELAYRHKRSFAAGDGYRDRHPGSSFAAQSTLLTEARREFDWLREGSTVVQQGALRDLDRAFHNFFGGRARYPRFRSAKDTRQGFVIRDLTVRRLNRHWGQVQVPKGGWLRFAISRDWKAIASCTSARVTVESGQWHVSFTCPPPPKKTTGTGQVGIDRGVAVTAATSDGELLNIPGLSEGEQQRLAKLQRRKARQPKPKRRSETSQRRRATHNAIADLLTTGRNRRRDWIEKTSTTLAERYSHIAIEKLPAANMVKRVAPKPDPDCDGHWLPNGQAAKRGLNREISGSCWGMLSARLRDKNDIVVEVPAAFTSQRCNACGHTERRNRKSQARFRCMKCDHTGDADTNAARNIRDIAFRHVASGRGTPATARNTATCNANQQITGKAA